MVIAKMVIFQGHNPYSQVVLRLLQGYTHLGASGASSWEKLDVLKQDVQYYGLEVSWMPSLNLES